jgi:probable HAF family extracellular repeat protein
MALRLLNFLFTTALISSPSLADQAGFLWDGTNVQTFTYPGAQVPTDPTAVADNGLIAGNIGTSGFIKSGSTYSQFSIPGSNVFTYGINESATVVGAYLGPEIGGGPIGWYAFTRSGSQISSYQAPNTKGAVAETDFKGINDQGQIAGYYELFVPNPVLWTSFVLTGSSMAEIAYPGAFETFGEAINDSGDVVGFYDDADLNEHAFLKVGTTYRNIDPTGPSGFSSAISISNSGLVLGYAQTGLFVYDLSTGTYLDESVPLSKLSSTFTSFQATAIDSTGELVGEGVLRAIPEPGSLELLCLAALIGCAVGCALTRRNLRWLRGATERHKSAT